MKKFHERNTTKTDWKRELKRKKLHISDGNRSSALNATQIKDALGCSMSQAHRLINGENALSDSNRELLLYKHLGVISGCPGYYLESEGIRSPNGYLIGTADLENVSLVNQLVNSLTLENQTLKDEIEQLKARIEWQNAKLAQPHNLQKLTGPRVVKFKERVQSG